MKVTINIELEGHPKKVNQDFSDWYRGMRKDMDRLTASGPQGPIIWTADEHGPKKSPEAARDKDQDTASTGDWKDEFVAELRKAWGTDSASNASNQCVPPKYLRDEPLTSDDDAIHFRELRAHAEAVHAANVASQQKLDAVKVDPFRPLVHGSTDAWKYPPEFINEFNHLLDKRRLEFRETLLRVFSDATPEECSRTLQQKKCAMGVSDVVNEVLRRRRGDA